MRWVSIALSPRSNAPAALRSCLVAFDPSVPGNSKSAIAGVETTTTAGKFGAAYLQLLQPVLTLGRLALLAVSTLPFLTLAMSVMAFLHIHGLLATCLSLALLVVDIKLRFEFGSCLLRL